MLCRQTNGPCHPGLKKAEHSLEDQIYFILRKRRIISNIRYLKWLIIKLFYKYILYLCVLIFKNVVLNQFLLSQLIKNMYLWMIRLIRF